jgi:hypothetical protein
MKKKISEIKVKKFNCIGIDYPEFKICEKCKFIKECTFKKDKND